MDQQDHAQVAHNPFDDPKSMTESTTALASPLPKIFVFDYSGFCTRVRMILGLKCIKHDLVFVAYHDAATPIALVGVKQVPILHLPAGEAMLESMDIVRYLDNNYGENALLAESAERQDLKQWFHDMAPVFRVLCTPRFHASVLPEFAVSESREYFRFKKERSLGSFQATLDQTPQLLEQTNTALGRLAKLFHSDRNVNESLSYDDLDVFSRLRGLTLVKGLVWPEKLRQYMEIMSQASDVLLFDSMAL